MTEEILIDIKLPSAEENDKKVDELTKSITALTDANKELQKQNEALAKSGQKNTQEYLNNAKQVEVNKQKINENSASRKGLIQVIQAEDNSLKALRVQNAELIKQRDSINIKTKEGQAAIQNINRQLDANNKVIKENSSALEKQKINIGNYASALDNVVPGLGGFATGISNLINPITAVSAGLGSLVALYSKSTIGTKDLEFASNQLSATMNALGNSFASLFSSAEDGEGFFSQLSFGLLAQVDLTSAVLGKVSALNQEKLEDLNRDAKVALTEQQNLLEDNADILEKLADSQTNYNDAIYLSNTAIDNVRNGAEKVRIVRQQELEVLEQQLAIDSQNEALQDAILDKKLQIAQEARREERLVNNIQKIQSNLTDAENKRLEAVTKTAEKEELILKHKQAQVDLSYNLDTEKIISDAAAVDKGEITSAVLINEMTLETEHLSEAIKKKNKATQDDIKVSNAATKSDNERVKSLLILSNALGGASTLFKKNTIAHKLLSAAQAGINSYLAGTEVLAQTKGGSIQRIIGMIATIAAGIAQQVNILRTDVSAAAGGGKFLTKGPTMLLVGDNPGGVERVTVEPLSGRGQTKVVKGSGLTQIAMAGGGELTTVGANETRFATNEAQSRFDINQMASLINSIQPILVREDYELAQMQHNQTITRSKVV